MITNEDLKKVESLIEDFKPKISFFEKEILIPAVNGRLEYLVSIFVEFQQICKEKDVATHIDAPLRLIVNPNKLNVQLPEPKVGEQYLSIIHKMLQDEYIEPIRKLMAKYPTQDIAKDIESLTNYLNDVNNVLISIPATKDKLFQYSLRSFPNIKEISSGKIILGPPSEISLILMPFQTRLEELVNVAQTTIDSIKAWAEQMRDQKKKHVEAIINLCQVKAAEEQANASKEDLRSAQEQTKAAKESVEAAKQSVIVAKKNLWIQVAVIVFTIGTVIVSQRVNLLLERIELEKALGEKSSSLAISAEKVNEGLKRESVCNEKVVAIQSSLKQCELEKSKK